MMLEIIDLLYDRQGSDRYMRSGSPAQDGGGWPSAQRPHSDEATSSPVRYGSGPGSDPHDGSGGRREVPFGPEISWPYGFRPMDSESREVLESAYGTGPVYSQPAVEDYGYGDPGYADPSYEGPRTPHGGPAFDGPAVGGRPGSSANAAAFGRIRLPATRGRPARVLRPGDPRFGTARARGPRLPAAGLRAAIRRPGDLAGDRRPGSAARHWSPAHRTADRTADRAVGRAVGRGCLGLRPLPAGSQPGLPGSVVRQPAPE